MAKKQYSVTKLKKLYLDGYTYEDISRLMNCSVNTTSYRIKVMKDNDPSIKPRGRVNESHQLNKAKDRAQRNARLLNAWGGDPMISDQYRQTMAKRRAQYQNVLNIAARIGTTGAVYEMAMGVLEELDLILSAQERAGNEQAKLMFLGLTCEHCGRMHSEGPCNRYEYKDECYDQ